jgi:hypothetical protein
VKKAPAVIVPCVDVGSKKKQFQHPGASLPCGHKKRNLPLEIPAVKKPGILLKKRFRPFQVARFDGLVYVQNAVQSASDNAKISIDLLPINRRFLL